MSAAPVDGVVADARAQRRRRLRLVVVGVASAAVVVGGLTWWAQRESPAPPPKDLAPVAVTRAPNPVKVAWYANGSLHLQKVAVAVPPLTDLAELNGGVVYGDHEGTVAFVAADGERRRLGRKVVDSPLLASREEGWAAWVDPGDGDGDAPTLDVYDVNAGELLDSRDLPSTDVRLVAIDQRQVFYEEADGTFSWVPGDGPPVRLERDGLLDVESRNRVYQLDGSIEMEQGFFNVSFVRPGTGAQISPGGVLVLTRKPDPEVAEGQPFRPLLYDARSGDRKRAGLSIDERAVDATFGEGNTAVYLVAQVADLVGGSDIDGNVDPLLVLRTCDLTGGRCTDVAPVQSGTDRPILAH
ncbi:hypothetical protein GCM10023349_37770 [Nocardioides conyzicola]|uniref:Uncharacterized protein n=1 Tax=Nocardioides conyzicola TaxID=1651781 RepID=A0ABP8XUJ7_9ACTN